MYKYDKELKQYNSADIKTIMLLVEEMCDNENITLQDVVTRLLNEKMIELDLEALTDEAMEFNHIRRTYE